jgi:hypothetical protein
MPSSRPIDGDSPSKGVSFEMGWPGPFGSRGCTLWSARRAAVHTLLRHCPVDIVAVAVLLLLPLPLLLLLKLALARNAAAPDSSTTPSNDTAERDGDGGGDESPPAKRADALIRQP